MINTKLLTHYLQYFEIIRTNEYILYHDDFYLSYYFFLQNIEIYNMYNDIEIQKKNNGWVYHMTDSCNIDALCNITGKYERNNLCKEIIHFLTELKLQNKFDFLTC